MDPTEQPDPVSQYAQWLVRNQHAKGTPEWESVAQTYRQLRTEQDAQRAQQQQQPAPETSGLGSLWHGFERNVLPIAGGVATGAALGSEVPIAGNIIGGIAGGLAAAKAQQKALELMPNVAKSLGQDPAQQQAEREQHPWASIIGENLPALAAFRPSMNWMASAGTEAKQLAKQAAAKEAAGEATTQAEKEAALRVAQVQKARRDAALTSTISGGLTGGLDVAQQALGDQPFDAREALIAAATGALGTERTGIGAKLEGAGESAMARLLGRESTIPARSTEMSTSSGNAQPTEQMQLPLGNEQQGLDLGQRPPAEQEHEFTQPAVDENGKEIPGKFNYQAPKVPEALDNQLTLDLHAPEFKLTHPEGEIGRLTHPASLGEVTEDTRIDRPSVPLIEGGDEIQGLEDLQPSDPLVPVKDHLDALDEGRERPNFIKLKRLANDAGIEIPKGLKAPEIITKLREAVGEEAQDVGGENRASPDAGAVAVGNAPPVHINDAGRSEAGQPEPSGVDGTVSNADRSAGGAKTELAPLKTATAADEAALAMPMDDEANRVVKRASRAFSNGLVDHSQLVNISDLLDEGRIEEANAILDEATGQTAEKKARRANLQNLKAAFQKKATETQTPEGKPLSDEDKAMQEYAARRAAEDAAKGPTRRVRDRGDTGLRLSWTEQRLFGGKPETSGITLSKDTAQQIADEATANWKNRPKIEIHQDASTLPESVRDVNPKGAYDASTGIVHLVAGRNTASSLRATLFHESLGHYGLRQKFGDEYNAILGDLYDNGGPALRKAADAWLKAYGGGKFYEGRTPQEMQRIAVDEVMAKLSEKGAIQMPGISGAINRLIAWVRDFGRRMGMPIKYSENDVRNILRAMHAGVTEGRAQDFLRGPNPIRLSAEPERVQAPEAQDRSLDQILKERGEVINQYMPKPAFSRMRDAFKAMRDTDFNEYVRKLEDQSRNLKVFEAALRNAGELKSLGLENRGDFNDVHSRLAAAQAKGQHAVINELNPLLKSFKDAIRQYAKASGTSVRDAMVKLDAYRTALHEPERRAMLFASEAPLSKTVQYKGTGRTAADLRDDIMKEFYENKKMTAKEAQDKRDILDDLVGAKNGFKSQYLDPEGYSPSGKRSITHTDPAYDVAGTYTQPEIASMKAGHDDEMADPKTKRQLETVWEAMNALQKRTIELNRKARYWSNPVDNLVSLYGYKHYTPFKGNPNANAERYDYASKRLGGSFSEYEQKAEGRTTDSDNSIVQTMVDAARSAARVGRADAATAFRNLIHQGFIKSPDAKKEWKVAFKDRYNDATLAKEVQGQNHFFHYNDDGSFNVYRIDKSDHKYLEALKGEIQDRESFLQKAADVIRPVTTGMGKMHTLMNVAFAPYNFARHLVTNSLAISATHGMKYLPELATRAMMNTVTGRFGTAMSIYNKYAMSGDMAGLERIAARAGKDSFASNLMEYLKNGGDTTMMDALSHKAALNNILDEAQRVNGNLLKVTTGKLGDMLQVWAHGFELTNRVTMYGVLKKIAQGEIRKANPKISDAELEAQSQSRAAADAKNLLNFQNVGTYGRDLSSVFMFWRANATGAVRALDAMRPAFMSEDQYVASLPKTLSEEARMQAAAQFKLQQKYARMTGAFMMGAGFGLYQIARQMASNDEQGRNIIATDNMDQWERNIRFPAAFFGDKNNNAFVQMPWGYGIGAIGSVGAQIGGALEGHTSLKDTIWNIINPLRESFFPVPTASFNPMTDTSTALKFVVDSATPSAFRPLVEAAMNIDTFGREVFNSHVSKYGDVYSAGESVPGIYKDITHYILDHTGLQVDPQTVQFVLSNYADGAARFAQNIHSDLSAATGVADWDPKRSMLTMPFSNFIGKTTSVDAKEFSEAEREVQKMRNIVDMYQSTGHIEQLQSYMEGHPEAPALIQLYNRSVNGNIKQFRHLISQVEAAEMTPKDKHEILKDLRAGRDMSMRGFLDAYKAITEED